MPIARSAEAMRRGFLLVLLGSLVIRAGADAAETRTSRPLQALPELKACTSTTHPRLPSRWRATYLMAPFTSGQLVLAEVVHDGQLGATRVTLHGVKRGVADFLVTTSTTYELSSERQTVTGCRDLGDTGWRPLPPDWLTPESRCTATAPILNTPAEWWKTPTEPAPSTYWMWTKTSDRTPFRLVFEAPSDRLAPFSRFALSYQVSFAPGAGSNLAELTAMCGKAKPSTERGGADALGRRLAAMDKAPERTDRTIERLMPALQTDCPAPNDLHWPERLAITGILTPFDATEDPAPTEVLYDWNLPGQLTRVFPHRRTDITSQDALLRAEGGYTVTHRRNHAPSCAPGLPGTIRPDWPTRAPCSCEGMIKAGTPISPDEPTRILSCPLAPPRVAWAWYGASGRPSMFMVTARSSDAGAGDFAVLDYSLWTPVRALPRSAFTTPLQCIKPSAARVGPRPPASCSTCHLAASTN